MNFRQKLFYIPFQDAVSKNFKIFNQTFEFSYDVSQRNVTAAKVYPPKREIDVSCLQNRYVRLP